MNREILFRGKRVDNGDWVYGLIHYTMMGKICIIAFSDDFYYNSTYEVIPETVGQFTGLKDKNGVNIFEGDVYKTNEFSLEYVVAFHKASFCGGLNGEDKGIKNFQPLDWEINEDEFIDDCNFSSTIEITGNIHDNDKI